MPKVFHGITIPDPITAEINARFGPEWTVGHIVGWLLEREVHRWCEENAKELLQKPIETPKTCFVIHYGADPRVNEYICEVDGRLRLGRSDNPGVLRFATESDATEFANINSIPLDGPYSVVETTYERD